MRKTLTIICFVLLVTPALGADYYVASTAVGSEDCSSTGDACTLTTLDTNWSTIRTSLDSEDVNVNLKRGDTFTLSARWAVLGDTVTDKTYRLYIKDYGSGDKPKIRRAGGTELIRLNENSNVTFENLDLAFTGTPDNGSRGIDWKNDDANGAGGLHIITCDFSNIDYYAIAIHGDSDYPIIQGNTFTDVGNGLYTINATSGSSDYGYAADNTCTNMDWGNVFGSDGHCIAITDASYWVVEDNTSYNTASASYINFINTGSTGVYTVWRRNKTLGASEIHGHVVAYQDNNGTASSYGHLVYQNIIENTSTASSYGTAIVFMNMEPASIGNRAFNNTIYDVEDYGIGARDDNNRAYFYNNIVWTDGITSGDRLAYLYDRDLGGGMGSDNYFSKNLYYSGSGDPSAAAVWVDEGGTARTWAAWKATSGYDTDSPTPADPLFTLASSDDFSLSEGSPAIDTGTWLTTISDAAGSGTSFTVTDGAWFHGTFGSMVDEDGNAVAGSPIALSNGQTAVVSSVTGNTITVASSVTWTQNVTTIALSPVYGTAPDIGAVEYESPVPSNAIQGVSIN